MSTDRPASPVRLGPVAVFTTVAAHDDAVRLARMAVERGLAACVQLSTIESFYVWDARLQQEGELRLVFKTTADLYEPLRQALLECHPYDLPAIHAVALDRVHPPYARWIVDSTSPPAPADPGQPGTAAD